MRSAQIVNTTMWHNLVWIGGIWLVALVFAWLICHWLGYNAAAWAFTISAFCLGLLVGAENTTNGKTRCRSSRVSTTAISYTTRPVAKRKTARIDQCERRTA